MKPDPAYYAEIVARIGIEPDEALMVGDGIENDIIAASTAGLHTYYVTAESAPDDLPADAAGTLDNLRRLIYEDWLDTLSTHPPTPAMIAPELRGNVGTLFGMLTDVQPHFWEMRPDPAEWSILQIICHLLESESAVQRPRLQRILNEDNPFLAAPPPPMPDVTYVEGIGYEIAEQFAAERLQTLTLLQQIEPEQWLRPARHSIFGPTTLLEMAHFTAQHDRLHLNQLCQTIGRCK
ncbi:MAG: DinB family protein, partial [Burkholderiales bacterium]|nr:DinB family protein [Anaerolineae bacterium]